MPINLSTPTQTDPYKALAERIIDLERKFNRVDRNGLPQVEDWTEVTSFTGSWVNYGAGYNTAAYCVDLFGWVHLKGLIKSGSIGSSAFTLPSGYRSVERCLFGVASNGAFGEVDVTSAGLVIPVVGSASSVSLDGISFRGA